MSSDFAVVAIIAAYNEADIIEQVVADLIDQDVGVYLLDDGSTDGTVAAVEPFVGRGVLAIERLPPPAGGPAQFGWERILLRKTELARSLDASWFLHHDADEFRESPWPHLSLNESIRQVDALGFNAIDFAGLDFWPTDDRFEAGADVRKALTFYSELAPYDRVQIRCWKKTDAVDLVSSGGHEARFPGRRVFPLRFLLRHYPIRGQAHGARKVFEERRPRFVAGERERGWHVQYDGLHEGAAFVKEPSTLTAFDGDAVRVALAAHHRDLDELTAARCQLDVSQAEIVRLRDEVQWLGSENVRREAEMADRDAHIGELAGHIGELARHIEAQAAEIASLRCANEAQQAECARLVRRLGQQSAEIEQWNAAVSGLTRQLQAVHQSVSWRWTAPARAALRVFTRARP